MRFRWVSGFFEGARAPAIVSAAIRSCVLGTEMEYLLRSVHSFVFGFGVVVHLAVAASMATATARQWNASVQEGWTMNMQFGNNVILLCALRFLSPVWLLVGTAVRRLATLQLWHIIYFRCARTHTHNTNTAISWFSGLQRKLYGMCAWPRFIHSHRCRYARLVHT